MHPQQTARGDAHEEDEDRGNIHGAISMSDFSEESDDGQERRLCPARLKAEPAAAVTGPSAPSG